MEGGSPGGQNKQNFVGGDLVALFSHCNSWNFAGTCTMSVFDIHLIEFFMNFWNIEKCPFAYWLNGRWFLQIVFVVVLGLPWIKYGCKKWWTKLHSRQLKISLINLKQSRLSTHGQCNVKILNIKRINDLTWLTLCKWLLRYYYWTYYSEMKHGDYIITYPMISLDLLYLQDWWKYCRLKSVLSLSIGQTGDTFVVVGNRIF